MTPPPSHQLASVDIRRKQFGVGVGLLLHPDHLQVVQMNTPNSTSIIANHCLVRAQLSSRNKRVRRRDAGKKQPGPHSPGTLPWQQEGGSRGMGTGHQDRERPSPHPGSCWLHEYRVQCPPLSFVNEITAYTFWGSFPKCVIRKRRDANKLSRKENSW